MLWWILISRVILWFYCVLGKDSFTFRDKTVRFSCSLTIVVDFSNDSYKKSIVIKQNWWKTKHIIVSTFYKRFLYQELLLSGVVVMTSMWFLFNRIQMCLRTRSRVQFRFVSHGLVYQNSLRKKLVTCGKQKYLAKLCNYGSIRWFNFLIHVYSVISYQFTVHFQKYVFLSLSK